MSKSIIQKHLHQEELTVFEEFDPTKTSTPTPLTKDVDDPDEKKIAQITHHFEKILQILGLDLSHSSLKKTPQRIANTYVKEFFRGLNPTNFPRLSFFEKEVDSGEDQIIFVKDVAIKSICEHHFVPMIGKAQIAYIPNKKIIGLSKIHRIADFFAKRPQVQERLTHQIIDCLCHVLETPHVAVVITLNHFCISFRGILDPESTTTTQLLRGQFKKDSMTRKEFLSKISS